MNRRQLPKVDYAALADGRGLNDVFAESSKVEEEVDDSNASFGSSASTPVEVAHSVSKFPIFVEEDGDDDNNLSSKQDVSTGGGCAESHEALLAGRSEEDRCLSSMVDEWVCERCDCVLANNTDTIKVHERSCRSAESGGDLPYCCGVCASRFGSLNLLERHFFTEHPNSSIRFPCVFCQRSFSKCHLLRDHAYNQHKIVWLMEMPALLDIRCRSCGQEFAATKDLVKHLQSSEARCGSSVNVLGLPVGRTFDIDVILSHAADVSLTYEQQLPGRSLYERVRNETDAAPKVSLQIVDDFETGEKRVVPVVLKSSKDANRKVKRKSVDVGSSGKKANLVKKAKFSSSGSSHQVLLVEGQTKLKLKSPSEHLKTKLERKLERIKAGVAALLCPHCHMMLDSKKQVQRHMRTHHANLSSKSAKMKSTPFQRHLSGISATVVEESAKKKKSMKKRIHLTPSENLPVVLIGKCEVDLAEAAIKEALSSQSHEKKLASTHVMDHGHEDDEWNNLVMAEELDSNTDDSALAWPWSPGSYSDEDNLSAEGIMQDIVELPNDYVHTTIVEVLRPDPSFLNKLEEEDDEEDGNETGFIMSPAAAEESVLVPPPDAGIHLSVEQGERRTEIQFVMNDADFEDNVNSMVVTQHDLTTSGDWPLHAAHAPISHEDDAPLSEVARTLEEMPPIPRPMRARGRGRRGFMRSGMWADSRPLLIPLARTKKMPIVRGPRGRPRGSCSNQSMRGRTLSAPTLQTKTVAALACEECVRLFSSSSSLDAHVRARHAPFRAPPPDYPPLPPVPSLPPARLRAALSAGPRAAGVSSRGRRGASHSGLTRQMLQHLIATGQHKIHEVEQTQYCQPCDRQFPTHSAYAAHCKIRHSRPLAPTMPQQHQNQPQLQSLEQTQQAQGQARCSLCKLLFTRRIDRDRHVQMKHADHIGFECLRCGQHFELIYQLNTHLRRQHNLAPEGNFDVLSSSEDPQDLNGSVDDSSAMMVNSANSTIATGTVERRLEPFLCNICGVSFGRPEPLVNHYLSAHVHGLPSDSAPPLPHKCNICAEGFTLSAQRDEHIRIEHHADGAFDCADCDAVFTTFLSLRRHQKNMHKMFADVVDLSSTAAESKEQIRSAPLQGGGDDSENEEEILLACAAEGDRDPDDSETNVRASDLLAVIHNQLRQLSVPEAGEEDAAAVEAATLLAQEEAAPSLELYLYLCQQCGEGFHNKTELGKHIIAHARRRQRFGCKRCGQIFEGSTAKKDLIDHVKVDHMGKPAFQCPDCLRQFTFTSALKKHRYRHRCETTRSLRRLSAFGCSLCDKIFCARGAELRFQRHWENCTGTIVRARPADLPPLVEETGTSIFEGQRKFSGGGGLTAREALAMRRVQQQQLQQPPQPQPLIHYEELDVSNLDPDTLAQLEQLQRSKAALRSRFEKLVEVDQNQDDGEADSNEDPDAWLVANDATSKQHATSRQ